MKMLATALMLSAAVGQAHAQSNDQTARIDALEARVKALEQNATGSNPASPIKPSPSTNEAIQRLGDFSFELIRCTRQVNAKESARCSFSVRNIGASPSRLQFANLAFTNNERETVIAGVSNETGVAVGINLQPKEEVQFFAVGYAGFSTPTVRSVKVVIGTSFILFENIPIKN